MSGRDRKRDGKFDMKSIDELQREKLKEERERYDHREIDEQNVEFTRAAS